MAHKPRASPPLTGGGWGGGGGATVRRPLPQPPPARGGGQHCLLFRLRLSPTWKLSITVFSPAAPRHLLGGGTAIRVVFRQLQLDHLPARTSPTLELRTCAGAWPIALPRVQGHRFSITVDSGLSLHQRLPGILQLRTPASGRMPRRLATSCRSSPRPCRCRGGSGPCPSSRWWFEFDSRQLSGLISSASTMRI